MSTPESFHEATERAVCEGCSRWRTFPWPAVRVTRLCEECMRLAEKVQKGDERAKALVRSVRGLWAMRVRLLRWLRFDGPERPT